MYAMDILWGIQTSEIRKSFEVQQLQFIGSSSISIVLQILALCVQIIFLWKKQIFVVFWTAILFVFGDKTPNKPCSLVRIVLMNNSAD